MGIRFVNGKLVRTPSPVQTTERSRDFAKALDKYTNAVMLGVPTGRSCDGCTECCTHIAVGALKKPLQCRCEHQTETGCGIYGKHPSECKTYMCVWRMGWGTAEDRPDKSGVILHIDRHPEHPDAPDRSGLEIIETKPGGMAKMFPGGGKEIADAVPESMGMLITLHFHGTPRCQHPDTSEQYAKVTKSVPGETEDYIGNDRVMVQLGVIDRSGNLHSSVGVIDKDRVKAFRDYVWKEKGRPVQSET